MNESLEPEVMASSWSRLIASTDEESSLPQFFCVFPLNNYDPNSEKNRVSCILRYHLIHIVELHISETKVGGMAVRLSFSVITQADAKEKSNLD